MALDKAARICPPDRELRQKIERREKETDRESEGKNIKDVGAWELPGEML